MLKKVTGAAKDRLKQRLHHGQAPMPSKPRSRSHRAAMSAVSLSAVDNAAFENILDDDTDFMSEFNHDHTTPATLSTSNLAKHHVPTHTESQEFDLFDADMFVYVDKPGKDMAADEEEENGEGEGLVNCDPLSGQIVSQCVKGEKSGTRNEEDIKNGNEEFRNEEESRNGNKDIRNEADEIGNEADITICNGEVNDNGLEIKNEMASETGTHVKNGPGNDASVIDSNVGLLEESSSDEQLFDNEDRIIKPIPIPIVHLETAYQSSPPQNTTHSDHRRELSHHSESGLSAAMSDASPLSSLPSSLENEFHTSLSAPSETAVPQTSEKKEPTRQYSPPLFPADTDCTPIVKHYYGMNSTPSTLKTHSQDGSPLESELEQLLASPKSNLDCMLSKSPSDGRSEQRSSRLSLEREGGSAHLDSGVFEHYGTESDSTPEREREKTVRRERRKVEDDKDGGKEEELFIIEEDYFAAAHDAQHLAVRTTPLSRPEDHTHFSPATSLDTSDDHAHPSTAVPPLKPSSSSSTTYPRGNGKYKAAPPPRPPLSPLMRKKLNAKRAPAGIAPPLSGANEVRVKYVQPLGRAKPWNQSEAVPNRKTELEERVVADDLFLEDTKKLEDSRTATSLSDEMKMERKLVSLTDQVESSHVKPADTATAEVRELSPGNSDHPDYTCASQSSITSTSTATVSYVEDRELYLTLPYHFALSALLYFYYSLNIFPYLAGLFAGFFTLFLFLGSIFIYYVHTIEKEQKERKQQQRLRDVKLSDDFVQTMRVDFTKLKVYQVRS